MSQVFPRTAVERVLMFSRLLVCLIPTLSSSGSGPGASENQTPPSPLLASLARHAPFMALQAASSVPRAAGLARQPRQLRAWRRREIGARWPASPRDSRSSTSAPTPSRWPLTTAGASGANVESKATAGERRAAEVVVRNGELEGNYSSSNSAARHRSALPCIHADKNYASFPRPTRRRFCSFTADFDRTSPSTPAHATSSSSARSICAAQGRHGLRTRPSIRDLRSISPFFLYVFSALTLLVGALRVSTGGLGPGLDAWEVPMMSS